MFSCPCSALKIYAVNIPAILVWLPAIIACWVTISPVWNLVVFAISAILSSVVYLVIASWFHSAHQDITLGSNEKTFPKSIRKTTTIVFTLINIIYTSAIILVIIGVEKKHWIFVINTILSLLSSWCTSSTAFLYQPNNVTELSQIIKGCWIYTLTSQNTELYWLGKGL